MQLSVVIPTLDEASCIARTIRSAWGLRPIEVIVSDGHSSDGTCDIARTEGAVVVESERGRGTQLNVGVQRAAGDVLLFLHSDTWLLPTSRGQMDAALADDRIVGGAFRQQIENPRLIFRWLERGNALRVRWLRLPYGDQGIFLRRSAFDALGGFPDVRLMEDVLLMREIRRRNWPIRLLDGPIHVDPRRWIERGVVRQTLRNWCLLAGLQLGVPPNRLADWY